MSSVHLTLTVLVACCSTSGFTEAAASCSKDVCSDESGESVDANALLVVQTQVESASMQRLLQSHKEASLDLSQQFGLRAKSMPDVSSATKSLFQSFKVCGQCGSYQRFGEPNDGGYLMCMDGLKQGSVSAAYSLGVEHHDLWSEDVTKHLGITVNQFDCTVNSGSNCQACKFFKKCIVSADGNHPVPDHETEGWSLNQALSETGQATAADGSLLMKMDIESSEWPIYASEPPEVLKKFGELIVEFHNLQDQGRHAEYLQAMQHIQAAGFKVAHLHGNNYGSMYQTGDKSIPEVLEVTFVHGAARPEGCAADQLYEKLDAPNNPTAPELPNAHLG